MGQSPPPIYDGSEESKRQFRKWVLREAGISTFRMICIAFGMAVLTLLIRIIISRSLT